MEITNKSTAPPYVTNIFPGSYGIADYHFSDGTVITCTAEEIKNLRPK